MWQIISTFLCGMIAIIGVIAFFRILLEQKIAISKNKLIAIILLASILYDLAYTLFQETCKTIIMLLINTCICKKIFNITYQKSAFLTFLWIIILFVPDGIETLFFTKILNLNAYYYSAFAGSLISNIIVFILLVLFTYIIREPLRKLVNTKIDNNMKIILYSFLTCVCISNLFYEVFNKAVLSTDLIINILVMLAFGMILFSLIKQTIENNKLMNEYDKLLEFMSTYELEIEKQRILRHETKNEFLTIKAKICDKQKEQEIINYIDEIIEDKFIVKQEEYAKFGYLPPNGIKGLCYFKTQEAEEKEITVALNISKRIKDCNIYNLTTKQQREFGKILGVLLDNAIEASAESNQKKLGIEAYTNKDKEFKMIISNSFNNKIEKDKIGKKRFSTKGKNRGHGLLLVKHIIGVNKIFELKTENTNDIFVQSITIKNLKKK